MIMKLHPFILLIIYSIGKASLELSNSINTLINRVCCQLEFAQSSQRVIFQAPQLISTRLNLSSIFFFQMEVEKNTEQFTNYVGMHTENVGLGFVARDISAQQKQATNQITFKIIKNDSKHQNLKYLLDLKNIFAKQLPKMPKEYIVKLVFDRHHESMIILKNGIKVVGGICFRQFTEEKFAEIAFLAITSSEQIKGFGTRLMNKLKEEMQSRRIEYLMTYADNLALGYFRKQGFSKECRMSVERWRGFIKDYQGGTMMECFVHPFIDYSKISYIIKAQKEFVTQKVKDLSMNQRKYEGKMLSEITSDPLTRINHLGIEETFKINPLQIPGIEESGWTWQDHEDLLKTKEVSFLIQCQNLIELIKKHPSSWPFREPVSLEDVPDYVLVVKEPIDLKTIEKKLSNNEYKDKAQFCQDIYRIFKNCRIYNQSETVYFKCANDLEDFAKPHIEALARGQVCLSDKRNGKSKPKSMQKKTKRVNNE